MNLIQLSESWEDGKSAVRTANSTRSLVQATQIGREVEVVWGETVEERSGFEGRLRTASPEGANAYSLKGQIGNIRYVQFYKMNSPDSRQVSEGVTLATADGQVMQTGIAYHPEYEDNCIPGIPK